MFLLAEAIPGILFWMLKVVIVLFGLFFVIKYAVKAALYEFHNNIHK